jgi:hypothetical protein
MMRAVDLHLATAVPFAVMSIDGRRAIVASARAAAGCTVTDVIMNARSRRLIADVSVNNAGGPIGGWRPIWSFGLGRKITRPWRRGERRHHRGDPSTFQGRLSPCHS